MKTITVNLYTHEPFSRRLASKATISTTVTTYAAIGRNETLQSRQRRTPNLQTA